MHRILFIYCYVGLKRVRSKLIDSIESMINYSFGVKYKTQVMMSPFSCFQSGSLILFFTETLCKSAHFQRLFSLGISFLFIYFCHHLTAGWDEWRTGGGSGAGDSSDQPAAANCCCWKGLLEGRTRVNAHWDLQSLLILVCRVWRVTARQHY